MSIHHTKQEDYSAAATSQNDGTEQNVAAGMSTTDQDQTSSKVIFVKARSSRGNNNESSLESLKDQSYFADEIINKQANQVQQRVQGQIQPVIHFHSHHQTAAAPVQSFTMPRSPAQTITSHMIVARANNSSSNYASLKLGPDQVHPQTPLLLLSQSQSQSDLNNNNTLGLKSQRKPVIKNQLNSANPKRYNLPQTNGNTLNLHVVIHEVSIQIPSSISLIVVCIINEERFETLKKKRVDSATKVADFCDQELIIPVVRPESYEPVKESQIFGLKLMAVNENKQKLIGLYQLKVHLGRFESLEKKRFSFDKCIDKNGTITFSASLKSQGSQNLVGKFEEQKSNSSAQYNQQMNHQRPVSAIAFNASLLQQSMAQARIHAQIREDRQAPVLEPSSSGNNLGNNTDEDESNLINKEDFEEGKTKAIVTSRETPIKANAMSRKNMSTARKHTGNFAQSPALRGAVDYQDPNNPSNLYYQLVNNNMGTPQSRMMSQTYRNGNTQESEQQRANLQQLLLFKPEAADQLATERRDGNQMTVDETANLQQIKGIYNQAQQSASAACSRSSGLVYLRQTPIRQTRRAEIKLNNKPPLQTSSFQQICDQLSNQIKISSLNFMNELTNPTPNNNNNSRPQTQQSHVMNQYYKSQQPAHNDETIIKRLQDEMELLKRENELLLDLQSKSQNSLDSRIAEEQQRYNFLNQEKSILQQEVELLRSQQVIEQSQVKLYQANEQQMQQDIASYQVQLQELQLKYERQQQLSSLYESHYLSAQTELEAYRTQSGEYQSLVAAKEQELISLKTETNAAINSLQGQLSNEKEEWIKKRREMQAQIDYRGSELDKRDLEIAELRDRLKKRDDENSMLKGEAKGHVQKIDAQYRDEIESYKHDNQKLKEEMKQMTQMIEKEVQKRKEACDQKRDIEDRFERQREMMKNSARELIETQSQVADIEEKLMITERQLISAKSSWAQAEHERETMYNQVQEQMERVQELEEKIEQMSKSRKGGPDSIITTKTSSTN